MKGRRKNNMTPEEARAKIDAIKEEEMKEAADSTLETPPNAPTTTIVKQYGKYQYSVFLKGKRDEQLVIRTDTFRELIEAKKNVDLILQKVDAKKVTPPAPREPDPNLQVTCWSCGEPAQHKTIVSRKNGKSYRILECSTGNRSHTKFL